MPLDALCLSGLVRELDQTVTGGKIDKIYQPGRDEVILALRTPAQGNVRLLLSANPSHPRPQLTQLTGGTRTRPPCSVFSRASTCPAPPSRPGARPPRSPGSPLPWGG